MDLTRRAGKECARHRDAPPAARRGGSLPHPAQALRDELIDVTILIAPDLCFVKQNRDNPPPDSLRFRGRIELVQCG